MIRGMYRWEDGMVISKMPSQDHQLSSGCAGVSFRGFFSGFASPSVWTIASHLNVSDKIFLHTHCYIQLTRNMTFSEATFGVLLSKLHIEWPSSYLRPGFPFTFLAVRICHDILHVIHGPMLHWMNQHVMMLKSFIVWGPRQRLPCPPLECTFVDVFGTRKADREVHMSVYDKS